MTNKATKYGLMTIAAVMFVALAFAGAASAADDDRTITFNATIGSGEEYTQIVANNTRTPLYPFAGNFTAPDGKAFVGWAIENCTYLYYIDKQNATLTADTKLYAVWNTIWDTDWILSEDVSLTDNLVVPADATVVIDLNGHTLKGTGNGCVIVNYGNLTVQDSVGGGMITNGSSRMGGGVFVYGGGTFTLVNGTITNCKAESTGLDGWGGGVDGEYASNIVLLGGVISDCSASTSGGGVYSNGNIVMSDCKITGCVAKYGGGVCGGDFVMSGGLITGCYATRGGGVYDNGVFTMSGGTIIDCRANFTSGTTSKLGGGVVVSTGKTFVMSGGTIEDCDSDLQGGGVYSFGTMEMTGGKIVGCSALNGAGGGIRSQGNLVMSGGEITGCSGRSGGGVFSSVGDFVMIGGNIVNCSGTSSTSYGGGIDCNGRNLTISGGTITGCSATYGGGVYFATSNTFTMTGGEILYCKANAGGGGLAAFNGNSIINITGGRIAYCISGPDGEADGGGIKAQCELHFGGTAVVENCYSATDGGGLSVMSDARFYLEGGTIRNNVAVRNGGGLSVWNGYCWISDGVFENNTAGMYGGAIDLGNTWLRVKDGVYNPNVGQVKSSCIIVGGIFRDNNKDGNHNAISTYRRDSDRHACLIVGGNLTLEGDQTFLLVDLPTNGGSFMIGTPVKGVLANTDIVTNFTDEKFTGSVKNFIIDNDDLDGRTLFTVNVTGDGQTAADILGRLGLNDTTKWTLTAVEEPTPMINIALNKPVASSASVLFNSSNNNATAYVNITLTDDNNAASAVVEFWKGGTKFKSSNLVTENLTKGSTVGGFVVEGLSDNTEYTVKAKLNMTDCVKYFDYDLGTFNCSDPKITEHPQSAVYKFGETATELTVTADAVDPKYQWENSTDGVIYNPISGANCSAYTPSNATVGIVYYRVNVTDNASGQSVNSIAAAIEVYDLYAITYDPQEGTNPSENPTSYSSNETVVLKDPARTHYIGSWVNSDTSSPVSIIYKGTTGNLNLTAQYVPKEYIISYIDGGTHDNPASYNIESGTITLTDAAKSGYEFIGWYGNAAFQGEKVTSISSADPADIKLYAQWYPLTITKEVTAEGNVQFSGYESIALARTVGTQTVLSEITGLTPTKNITFVRAIPELSASDLPAKSGYYTNLYSAYKINYDGTLSGDAQITLKVTLANGDSADSLRALHQSSSGWEDLEDVSKTQSGNVVTIVGNVSSFSPFAVVSYSAVPQQYVPSSSKQTGSTIILQEGQVAPTPYPTVAPTGDSIEETDDLAEPAEQPATPTVIATAKPTTQATQQSPAPFVGILAGLGAAAVLLRLRK